MIRTLTCEQADLLLAGHAVGDLTPEEHRALRRHVIHCAPCRINAAAYLRVADQLPLSVEAVEPPPGLRSRILAAVHAEAARAEAVSMRPALLRRIWLRIPSGRSLTLGGAFCTAAATVIAVLSLTASHGAQPATPSAPAAVLVRHTCGLTASPNSCATLRYDRAAKETTLTVTGLPQIPVVGGQPIGSYEVWLVRANGSTVAGAFLSPSPDGSTLSAAMAGDISSFVAVATTKEPAGGSPVPTGAELLRVDLTTA